MPGSDQKPTLVPTLTGDPGILAPDQQLVPALCAAELHDMCEKADALKRAFQAAVPHLGRVDQLCRISLQKPWMASFQEYRRLLSASSSLATRTVRFLHTYIHVYLPLILDRTVPEAEKIHELQTFLKHEGEAPPADVAARADKIRADIRKVHARLEAIVKSRAGASDPALAAAEAHIQTLQQDKERLAEKIEELLPRLSSATARSVAHWASIGIVLGKEGLSRAAVPIVVGLEAMRKRTFGHLYLLERPVEQPRAADEDPLRALRPCVFAVAVQLDALSPRLEAFGQIQPMILEHVANYISLAERAREHCGTAAEMEMRKKECATQSAAEGYANLADALEEYACSG